MNQGSLYQRTHQLNWANQCHVHLPVHIPNSLLRATGNPASPAVHLSRHESSAKLWFMESHHWRNMRSFIIHTVCNFAVLNSNCPTTRKHPCLGCRSWKKGKKINVHSVFMHIQPKQPAINQSLLMGSCFMLAQHFEWFQVSQTFWNIAVASAVFSKPPW